MSQQLINIGSAPNDGTGDQLRVSFDKSNQNFSELYSGAGAGSEGLWNYNQTTTDTTTSPVAGRFRTNSGNYADATQIAIHATTIRGIDRTSSLRRLLVGDIIECHDSTNSNAWSRYVVQAVPVDYGSWFQINVGMLQHGTVTSSDNQEIYFFFTANTNPAPGANTEYRFSTNTAPPPGNGYIRCNNASLGAATILYVNVITNNGTDIRRNLTALSVGQELIIQDQANNANFGDYNVASAVIDQGSYIQIPVNSTASGGAITNNSIILFSIIGGAGGTAGGNVSNVGTPTNGQLAQWTDATHIQGIATASLGFAPLASPVFTGDPQAPTPATADNDTSIATTAFVKAQAYLTGNQTVTLSGDITGAGTTAIAATIANNAVTNAKLADMATARLRGRITAGTGDPEDLTGTQATTLLDVLTSSLKGLAPASGGGTTNFLRADATWAAPAASPPPPTYQVFTSGSGTYTTPANCKRIEVTLVGGGTGGGGGGGGGVGTAGGNTTFGTLTANGAAVNPTNYQSGAPGSASGGTINFTGGYGTDGAPASTASLSTGAHGGVTIFGGAGSGGHNRAGLAAAANTGAGGGGGGSNAANQNGGAGGSSGGACIGYINNPAATYSYAVGAGGNGGTAGTGFAGGNGGSGIIIVKEFY
jgi:hypothetical protein